MLSRVSLRGLLFVILTSLVVSLMARLYGAPAWAVIVAALVNGFVSGVLGWWVIPPRAAESR